MLGVEVHLGSRFITPWKAKGDLEFQILECIAQQQQAIEQAQKLDRSSKDIHATKASKKHLSDYKSIVSTPLEEQEKHQDA